MNSLSFALSDDTRSHVIETMRCDNVAGAVSLLTSLMETCLALVRVASTATSPSVPGIGLAPRNSAAVGVLLRFVW